jgi:hypothetical protein
MLDYQLANISLRRRAYAPPEKVRIIGVAGVGPLPLGLITRVPPLYVQATKIQT